jgi:hypothetical protein
MGLTKPLVSIHPALNRGLTTEVSARPGGTHSGLRLLYHIGPSEDTGGDESLLPTPMF